MPTYTLTAFERDGEKLLDETFEAANDEEAKKSASKNCVSAAVGTKHTVASMPAASSFYFTANQNTPGLFPGCCYLSKYSL